MALEPRRDDVPRWPYSRGFALGLGSGIVLALVYTSVATAIVLARWVAGAPPGDVGYGSQVALYFGGFTLTGLIGGALNPLARTALGASLLGVVGFIPVSLGAMRLVTGSLVPADSVDLFALVMTATLVGGATGFTFWREFVRARRS